MWRQFSQWLGGMGIIVLALAVLPRLRVGGRQLLESESPGPEFEALTRLDQGHGAPPLAPLRRADGAARPRLAVLGWTGVDERMGPLRGGRARVHDHADRRLRHRARGRSSPSLPPRSGCSRSSWPSRARTSPSSTARSSAASRARSSATRSSGCTSACSARRGGARRRPLGRRASRRARQPPARACSRPSRS